MKPTPRKLVLAMSIAGIGASLGGAAHARADAAASSVPAGLAMAVGLPLPALDDAPSAPWTVRVEGLPQALALPLDARLFAAEEGAPETPRHRLVCASGGGNGAAAAAPRPLSGPRRTAPRGPAHLQPETYAAAAAGPTAEAAAPGAAAAACGTAPVPDDPTRHRVVDGVGIRPPKAPPAKRTWEALGATDDGPDADPATHRTATAAQQVLEALALHRRGSGAADADLPQLDLDLDSFGGSAASGALHDTAAVDASHGVDLHLEIDPVTEPGTVAATADTPASAAAGVDIALDLELDFYLRSIAAAGSDASPAAVPGLDLELDLPATGATSSALPVDPPAAADMADAPRVPVAAGLDLVPDLVAPAAGEAVDPSPTGVATAPARRDGPGDASASRLRAAVAVPDAPATVPDPSSAADAPFAAAAPVTGRRAAALDLDLDQPAVGVVGPPTGRSSPDLDLSAAASTVFIDLPLDLPAAAPTALADLPLGLPTVALDASPQRHAGRGPDLDGRAAAVDLELDLDLRLPVIAAAAAHTAAALDSSGIAVASAVPDAADTSGALSGDEKRGRAASRDTARSTYEDAGRLRKQAAAPDASAAPAGGALPAPSEATASTAPDAGDAAPSVVGHPDAAPPASGTGTAIVTHAVAQAPLVPVPPDAATAPTGAVFADLSALTAPPLPTLPGEMVALGEGRLDEVRGGFQTSDGLHVSLGIERAVYINGNLVTTPSLNVVELGSGAGMRPAGGLPASGSTGVTLVQHGAGNTFLPGAMPATAAGTVIQNTLDGQTIQSITSISATVNSLEIMRARNLESSMRGAIVDSLRR